MISNYDSTANLETQVLWELFKVQTLTNDTNSIWSGSSGRGKGLVLTSYLTTIVICEIIFQMVEHTGFVALTFDFNTNLYINVEAKVESRT